MCIIVYLPTDYGNQDSQDRFAESLNELSGFIDSQSYDNMIIAGDFDVDFTRLSVNRDVLLTFISDLDLSIADMCDSSPPIQYSYIRDDGLVSSWPDHILTSSCHLDNLTVMGCFQSLENFSDHLPLHFNIKFPNSFPALTTPSTDVSSSLCIDWSQASLEVIDNYCQCILSQLPLLPPDQINCPDSSCQTHHSVIDHCCFELLSCIQSCALMCLPCKSARNIRNIPGWNDYVREDRSRAAFWHRVWCEAGCPSAGVKLDVPQQV